MSHTPVMLPSGFTCCGHDDPAIKWYFGAGYAIASRTPEEAAAIIRRGAARDLRHADRYNNECKKRLSKTLREGVHVIQKCLKEIQENV